jgi:hypothetical protein
MILLSARAALYVNFLRAEQTVNAGEKDRNSERTPRKTPQQWELAYAAAAILASAHFSLWSLMAFPEPSQVQRLIGLMFLWGLAGGAIAVLSIVRWLALAYGAILLLPGSIMLIGGVDERSIGALGFIYWLTVLFSVGRTHRRFVESFTLARRNAMQTEQMNRQSRALVDSNAQMRAAQDAMRSANLQLEQRIIDRAAQLHRLATHDIFDRGEFVPLAERSGDMVTLGNRVMREACRFATGFDSAQLRGISVNVSLQQLLHPGFVDDLLAALADSGLQSQRLTLELTE